MATNYRGVGDRVMLKAGGARLSGQAVVDQNFVGIAVNDAVLNAYYEAYLVGEFELAFIAGSVKGDVVAIHLTTGVLTRSAPYAAVAAGAIPFAKVTAVPGEGADTVPQTSGVGTEPKAGLMWARLFGPLNTLPGA